MVISAPTPRAQDSNADHRYSHFNTSHSIGSDGHIRSSADDGIHGIWWRRGRVVYGKLFPMMTSILRTAFENVITHISNVDDVRELVNDLEKQNEPVGHSIRVLEKKAEDAEVTLRTDIRILINECRHLQSKMTCR